MLQDFRPPELDPALNKVVPHQMGRALIELHGQLSAVCQFATSERPTHRPTVISPQSLRQYTSTGVSTFGVETILSAECDCLPLTHGHAVISHFVCSAHPFRQRVEYRVLEVRGDKVGVAPRVLELST